jgi:hypothetical protein
MKMICRDVDGNVINIGPWDYGFQEKPTGLKDADGKPIKKLVPTNVPPPGSTQEEVPDEHIVEGPDGGLYHKDDPRLKT